MQYRIENIQDKNEHVYVVTVTNTHHNTAEVTLRAVVHSVFEGEMAILTVDDLKGLEPSEESYYHDLADVVYLKGTWNYDQFRALDDTHHAKAYDVRYVKFGDEQVDMNDAYHRPMFPNCLFICNGYGRFNKNYVMMVDEQDPSMGYRAQNIEIFDTDKKKTEAENEAKKAAENLGKDQETIAKINFSAAADEGYMLYDMAQSINPIYAETGASFVRYNPTTTNWITMMVPFSAPLTTQENMTVYDLLQEEDNGEIIKLKFEPVEEMQAGKAYVINTHTVQTSIGTGVTKFDFTAKPVSGATTSYATMEGTYTTKKYKGSTNHNDDDEMYVLKWDGATSFTLKHLNGTLPAFRAGVKLDYQKFKNPNGEAKSVEIVIGETTGIYRHATAEEIEQIFNVYSIDGRLVKSNSQSVVGLPRGTYIINGKKVQVK